MASVGDLFFDRLEFQGWNSLSFSLPRMENVPVVLGSFRNRSLQEPQLSFAKWKFISGMSVPNWIVENSLVWSFDNS